MEEELNNKRKELRENEGIYVVSIDKILEKKYSPQVWMVEKLIPEQSITAISGAPESFKTWLTLEIARCVSQGSDFLGQFKTSTGNVLFLDKENHLSHIQERLQLLGIQKLPIFYFSRPDDFYIDKDKDYQSLIRAIDALNIKLVVFDSLVRIHTGDENTSRDIAKVMGAFRKITKKGVTVLFIHHNRKEGERKQSTTNSIRGSSDILAGIECLLQVTKPLKENYLGITQSKLRVAKKIEPFKVDIVSKDENSLEFKYSGLYNSNGPEVEEAKESILAVLKEKEEVSRPEFIDMLSDDYTTPTIDSALKELVKSEIIEIRKGASGKNFYSLKNKSVEP